MQTLSEHITNLQHRINMNILISKDDIDKKSILFIEDLTILVAQVRKSIILLREQKNIIIYSIVSQMDAESIPPLY